MNWISVCNYYSLLGSSLLLSIASHRVRKRVAGYHPRGGHFAFSAPVVRVRQQALQDTYFCTDPCNMQQLKCLSHVPPRTEPEALCWPWRIGSRTCSSGTQTIPTPRTERLHPRVHREPRITSHMMHMMSSYVAQHSKNRPAHGEARPHFSVSSSQGPKKNITPRVPHACTSNHVGGSPPSLPAWKSLPTIQTAPLFSTLRHRCRVQSIRPVRNLQPRSRSDRRQRERAS